MAWKYTNSPDCDCPDGHRCIRKVGFVKPIICVHESINPEEFDQIITSPISNPTHPQKVDFIFWAVIGIFVLIVIIFGEFKKKNIFLKTVCPFGFQTVCKMSPPA